MSDNSAMSIHSFKKSRSPLKIGQEIRSAKSRILSLREEQVRDEFRSAHQKDIHTLRDSLPQFLERLIQILSSDEAPESLPVQEVGQAHGEQRAELGDYSLEEVLREYSILRRILFDVVGETQEIKTQERDLILETFDTAIRQATTEFVRHQYEKLRADQARIESLLKEKENREQFVAIYVHDIKNPLSAVKMGAELLTKNMTPHLSESIASQITRDVDRIEQMILDLLDVSRIRAGQPMTLKFEVCDPVNLAKTLIQDMVLIYENPFSVSGLPSLQGMWSKEGLRRALENLLANAIKYGEKNSPIRVEFTRNNDMVCISVHNRGEPIPEEDFPSLFQLYHRTAAAEKSGRKGWGLGLVLVKAVAEAHQGTVEVESSREQGTLFTLVLPASSKQIYV